MKKAIDWLFLGVKIIFVIITLFIVSVIMMQRIFDNSLTIGGFRIFTIVTGSMEPEYGILDVIVSKEVESSKINVGDDVVYLGSEGTFRDKIVTHRVIEKRIDDDKVFLLTQGIASDYVDPEISEDQVYGVVLFKSHVLSFVSKLLSHPFGFVLLILVPGCILFVTEIMDKIKERE